MTSIPSKVGTLLPHCLPYDRSNGLLQRRNLLRLTAKSTQFGKNTFTSWLIESAGTVPLHRRKDFADGRVDNQEAMSKLMEVSLRLSDFG